MKQLTCEMCGGTDLLKQDGVFVCQTCGCKYSVEEARKMMGEVSSTPVEVKNAAQLENLLNLAKSSFTSKNYAQAENFCNQVIAMDDKNYEAWKLKGEAVNYQTTAVNDRILEAHNCIMTAFNLLSEEEKEIKKYDILASLKNCYESEVYFWLKQFEENRPTLAGVTASVTKIIDVFLTSRTKMTFAFIELGLNDSKDEYLTNFDNSFISNCITVCNNSWSTTVAYNYYREYMGKGIDPFGRSDQSWVIKNTDLYRPTKPIWDTFLEESTCLTLLLGYAEKQSNDDTSPELLKEIYNQIIHIHECVIQSGSWKVVWGKTSFWDEYETLGWHEEYTLADEAKSSRRQSINEYRKKLKEIPQKIEARQKAKQEKERKEKITKYWEEHAEEKAQLDNEQEKLAKKMDELNAQITAIEEKHAAELAQLREERDRRLPCEVEVSQQRDVIRKLEAQRAKCGIFKGKEKKAIQARLDNEARPKLEALKKIADDEKTIHHQKVDAQIAAIKEEEKELREEVAKLKKRSDEITAELTKDRK